MDGTKEQSGPDQFRCGCCGLWYDYVRDDSWSDEQARAELDENFPDSPVEECEVVCDDCYKYGAWELTSLDLKLWRVRRGLSQKRLAELLGVTQQALSTWEKRGIPPGWHIKKLLDEIDKKLGEQK